jgi:hypothetical protein
LNDSAFNPYVRYLGRRTIGKFAQVDRTAVAAVGVTLAEKRELIVVGYIVAVVAAGYIVAVVLAVAGLVGALVGQLQLVADMGLVLQRKFAAVVGMELRLVDRKRHPRRSRSKQLTRSRQTRMFAHFDSMWYRQRT